MCCTADLKLSLRESPEGKTRPLKTSGVPYWAQEKVEGRERGRSMVRGCLKESSLLLPLQFQGEWRLSAPMRKVGDSKNPTAQQMSSIKDRALRTRGFSVLRLLR